MFRKNNLLIARIPGISANLNENYRHNNFQALLIFPEILNFRKMYNPSDNAILPTQLLRNYKIPKVKNLACTFDALPKYFSFEYIHSESHD